MTSFKPSCSGSSQLCPLPDPSHHPAWHCRAFPGIPATHSVPVICPLKLALWDVSHDPTVPSGIFSYDHRGPRLHGSPPALPNIPELHLWGPPWSRRPSHPSLQLASRLRKLPETSPPGSGPWALRPSPVARGISSVVSSSSFWGTWQFLSLEFCQLKYKMRKSCCPNLCDPFNRQEAL